MKKIITWIKDLLKIIDDQCPQCGYYCSGKGGFGCIDKPRLMTPTETREEGERYD